MKSHKSRPGIFKDRFLPRSDKDIDMDFDRIKKMCVGKRIYESKRKAKEEAKRIGLNYYRCKFCGHYHLTSRGADKVQGERSKGDG